MLIVEGFWLCKEMWCMSEVGWGFSEKEDDRIAEYIMAYGKKPCLATSLEVKLEELEVIELAKNDSKPTFLVVHLLK